MNRTLKLASPHRRAMLAAVAAAALFAPSARAQSGSRHSMRVRRDAGCGCCQAWAAAMQRTGRFEVAVSNEADMAAVKQQLGVPSDLASCHTAEVEDYVIEGHVPAEDILRLLAERPAGVRGLAAPGMPVGSPGMEAPGAAGEAYDVFAFEAGGARRVFASHAPGA